LFIGWIANTEPIIVALALKQGYPNNTAVIQGPGNGRVASVEKARTHALICQWLGNFLWIADATIASGLY
jgi:hypothetical protein